MKKYIAEFLGTFFIVLVGCGAIVINQQYQGIVTHLGISIVFGTIVCLVIYAFAKLSTHFNPAVSIALFLANKLSLKHLIFFYAFQISGAIAASALLGFICPLNELLGTTQPNGYWLFSFVLEFILTFLLLLLIFILDKYPTKYAGVLIGLLIFLEAYFAGPICGASMNPARSIGPAIISGHLNYLWLYIVAPISGAISALSIKKLFIK